VRRAPGAAATITLRLATAEDAEAVERLAVLYDRPRLSGPVVVAVVDGELQAALTLAGDRELLEPYLPTAGLVDLLALRAKQLRDQPAPLARDAKPQAARPCPTDPSRRTRAQSWSSSVARRRARLRARVRRPCLRGTP
jgi:hypothetical protein